MSALWSILLSTAIERVTVAVTSVSRGSGTIIVCPGTVPVEVTVIGVAVAALAVIVAVLLFVAVTVPATGAPRVTVTGGIGMPPMALTVTTVPAAIVAVPVEVI